VRGEELFAMRREDDGGDLGRRGDGVQTGAGGAVPDVDGGVVSPAA
jgi:hypothetical protein